MPPVALPTHDTVSAAELQLGEIAWWDVQFIGFGHIPEYTPPPDQGILPDAYRQLRIGTLDGRVTSMLALHADWGHSYASLPVQGRVLVANDFASGSSIQAVDAATGRSTELLASRDQISAVAAVPGSNAFVYALADRMTGEGTGIWYSDGSAGEPMRVAAVPDGFGSGDVDVWQLVVSPDGVTLVAQFCFGAVRCATHVVDLESGDLRVTDAIGWQEGFLGGQLLARPLGGDETASERRLVRLDLDTLRTYPAGDFQVGGSSDRTGTFAAELPYGWRADWPEITGRDSMGAGTDRGRVRLVNGFTGEQLATPPLKLEWPDSCRPMTPAELPTGHQPGPSISTLEDGVRMIRFGAGGDLVVEAMGSLPAPPTGEGAVSVQIRGVPGLVFYATPSPLPPDTSLVVSVPTIQWEEAACWYRITLAPLTDAVEYAARF